MPRAGGLSFVGAVAALLLATAPFAPLGARTETAPGACEWDSLRSVVAQRRAAARIARVQSNPAALRERETAYAAQLAQTAAHISACDPAAIDAADGPALRFLLRQLLAARDETTRLWLRRNWRACAPALDPQGEIRFWVGLDALEAKDFGTAVDALSGPVPAALQPYAQWQAVLALEETDPEQSGARALEILERAPSHPFRGLLTIRAARHLTQSARGADARQLLERYLGTQPPEDWLRAAALTWLAEIHRAAGRAGEFHQAFCASARVAAGDSEAGPLRLKQARAILEACAAPAGGAAASGETGQPSANWPATSTLEACLQVIARLGSASEAYQAWTRLSLRLGPPSAARTADRLLEGLYKERADTLLLRFVQDLVSAARDTSAARAGAITRATLARAQLMAARVYRRLGNSVSMASAFEVAAQSQLDAARMSAAERETAALALWELAREYDDLESWDEAAQTYRRLEQRFPWDPNAREAGLHEALCTHRAGRTAEALAHLEELCRDAPHNLTGGPCLWRALLGSPLERIRFLERGAHETNPGYYARRASGALAADSSGAAGDSIYWAQLVRDAADAASWPWPAVEPLAPELSAQALTALIDDEPAAETGALFLAYGHARWARQFWSRLPGWRALEPRERAALLRALGDLEEAIRTGIQVKDALARYPVAYAAEVGEAAQRFDLSPALIFAVMRQESLFAPRALSRAGAQGLMQLMPATARRMADSLGWAAFDVGRPRDNVMLGTAHLAELLRATGGRLPVALAAYNAGLDRAWRWWRSARGPDDFIERIGFVETRGFVRNVLTHYAYYRALYR
jgi:soluble lytic murein transglycosylase-like protein